MTPAQLTLTARVLTMRGLPQTARQIIEARLCRQLPPTQELPRDLRDAVRLLGLQLLKTKVTK